MKVPDEVVIEWGRALRATMAATGTTQATLAAVLGVNPGSAMGWYRGRRMPSMARGLRIAEVLGSERLAETLIRLLTVRCEGCGQPFTETMHRSGGRERRWCGRSCKYTAHNKGREADDKAERRRRSQFWEYRAREARERLTIASDAVGAFCRACSPDGCRTPACELRPVSPIPLVARRASA